MIYKRSKKYIKECSRRYYLKHRQEILVRSKKARESHPEWAKKNHKINNKKYYESHRKAVIAKTLEWQRKNPEKWKNIFNKAMKKYRGTAKGIYRDIKQTTRVKNRGDLISKEDFIFWYEREEKKCIYCDKPQGKDEIRLSIERKDNSKGYIEGNLALACMDCNQVKSDILTFDEMRVVGEIVMKKRWVNNKT